MICHTVWYSITYSVKHQVLLSHHIRLVVNVTMFCSINIYVYSFVCMQIFIFFIHIGVQNVLHNFVLIICKIKAICLFIIIVGSYNLVGSHFLAVVNSK